MNLTKKKVYISRRKRQFDDSQSDDQDYIETEGSGYKDTGDITYMDTKGNQTVLKPNIRFTSYKNVFKDLLK